MKVVMVVLMAAMVSGCMKASYATPGRGANLGEIRTAVSADAQAANADPAVRQAIDLKPLARFPTALAVVRVQAAGYQSRTAQGYGTGRYSVVTERDVESDAALGRLGKLPLVKGVSPVSRLLLPPQLNTDAELRQVAGMLRADVLLIYTLDTTFHTNDTSNLLTTVTFGVLPTSTVRLSTTASALLVDTRNGYVYGIAEATEKSKQVRNEWSNEEDADRARRETEQKAFDKLVGAVESTWAGVIREHAPTYPTVGAVGGSDAGSMVGSVVGR